MIGLGVKRPSFRKGTGMCVGSDMSVLLCKTNPFTPRISPLPDAYHCQAL